MFLDMDHSDIARHAPPVHSQREAGASGSDRNTAWWLGVTQVPDLLRVRLPVACAAPRGDCGLDADRQRRRLLVRSGRRPRSLLLGRTQRPAGDQATRRGFGTRLIQDILANDSGWTVTLDNLPGLRCTMIIDPVATVRTGPVLAPLA
jgi:hypothetical protein